MTYVRVLVDLETCIGCGACAAVCPFVAFEMRDGKAFLIPEKCKDDFQCIDVCPVTCIWKPNEQNNFEPVKTEPVKSHPSWTRELKDEEL